MEFPAVADIDLEAYAANLRHVRSALGGQKILAVVKADAYGHGRAQCAQAALAAGADYLGVAQLAEAMWLRQEVGPGPRILTWMIPHGVDFTPAIEADLDISISTFTALDGIESAAQTCGKPARIHLKVDTAMSRGGFSLGDIAEAAARARALEESGLVRVVGLWSHLARADEPECGLTEVQVERFESARAEVARAGLDIELHHLAASAGTLWHPNTHYDMVRPGIALYGLSPEPAVETAQQLGLRAVMTLHAPLLLTRDVPAGTGISYGHTAVTEQPTRLGLVPLGYADGISRAASNRAPVQIWGMRTHIIGKVCMDQFLIPVPDSVHAGEEAILFGDSASGVPTADEWGQACGTNGYEILTHIGARVPRHYHGEGA